MDYFSSRFSALTPYVPGEQPASGSAYIKLNTNESPFPPSPAVREAVAGQIDALRLYGDPDCRALTEKAAALYGLAPGQLLFCNGSDEALNFAFMAFGDDKKGFAFPDITYGFYPVYARLHRLPYREIPLKKDLSIDPSDYLALGMNVVIANPNAPTGMALPAAEIEAIAASNPDSVVVVDEAYVDFGGESCLPLIKQYPNLLVTRTFSKAYSLAGARLGFAAGDEGLIRALNTLKYSTNPYNVNRMTMAAGLAALETNDYYMDNCARIAAVREETASHLRAMGFLVCPSSANFLLISHPDVGGRELYQSLKERGILVRHFDVPRVRACVRVTIGTAEQMETFLRQTAEILTEVRSNG